MTTMVKKEVPDPLVSPNMAKLPKPSPPKRKKITDFRLAERFEDDRLVRSLLRGGGRLIQWQNEKLTNVISLDALGLNSRIMCIVAEFHCANMELVKPPAINFLKAQAGTNTIKI